MALEHSTCKVPGPRVEPTTLLLQSHTAKSCGLTGPTRPTRLSNLPNTMKYTHLSCRLSAGPKPKQPYDWTQDTIDVTQSKQKKQLTKDSPGWRRMRGIRRMRGRASCQQMSTILAPNAPGGILAAANHGPGRGTSPAVTTRQWHTHAKQGTGRKNKQTRGSH